MIASRVWFWFVWAVALGVFLGVGNWIPYPQHLSLLFGFTPPPPSFAAGSSCGGSMLLCLDNKQVWEELAHEKGQGRIVTIFN